MVVESLFYLMHNGILQEFIKGIHFPSRNGIQLVNGHFVDDFFLAIIGYKPWTTPWNDHFFTPQGRHNKCTKPIVIN